MFTLTAAACIAAALLFGFVPAVIATNLDVPAGLRDGGSQGIQWLRSRFRSGLIVVPVAVCLVLLINAGLLGRSLANPYTEYPGFDIDRNIIVQLDSLPGQQGKTLTAPRLDQLASTPGVSSIAAARMVPLLGSGHGGVWGPASDRKVPAGFNEVTGSYFKVLGVPLLSGRVFGGNEERSGAAAAILSDAAVRTLFPSARRS